MQIEKTRRNMIGYLVCWAESFEEQEREAERLESMTDAEIEAEFTPLYEEMRGLVPPPVCDDDLYDANDYGHAVNS